MMLLLPIASLFLLSIVSGENINTYAVAEEEIFACISKLLCVLDKGEEFYYIGKNAGEENYQTYVDAAKESTDFDLPGQDLDFWMPFKDEVCSLSREKQEDLYKEASGIVTDHTLEVCLDAESEICILAQKALDEAFAVLSKYEATGDCPFSQEVPGINKHEPALPFG